MDTPEERPIAPPSTVPKVKRPAPRVPVDPLVEAELIDDDPVEAEPILPPRPVAPPPPRRHDAATDQMVELLQQQNRLLAEQLQQSREEPAERPVVIVDRPVYQQPSVPRVKSRGKDAGATVKSAGQSIMGCGCLLMLLGVLLPLIILIAIGVIGAASNAGR